MQWPHGLRGAAGDSLAGELVQGAADGGAAGELVQVRAQRRTSWEAVLRAPFCLWRPLSSHWASSLNILQLMALRVARSQWRSRGLIPYGVPQPTALRGPYSHWRPTADSAQESLQPLAPYSRQRSGD